MTKNYPQAQLVFILLLTVQTVQAQLLGGQSIFSFLQLPPSARVTALGGSLTTVMDDDGALAYQNPALLNPEQHQFVSINHSFYIDGIDHGYASYVHHIDKWETTVHGGVQYISYGEMPQTNVFFQQEGTFRAGEYAVNLGAGRQVDERLHLGANLKYVSSQFGPYSSSGLGFDLGALYKDTASMFTFALTANNFGFQFQPYEEAEKEPLPFDLQIGLSKRLRYLPFRFSIIYRYLNRWDLRYDDPNAGEDTIFLGEEPNEESDFSIFVDNLFRHFVFNGELLIGARDNFRLRFAYNHLRRQELSVNDFGSLAGFSFGVGIKVSNFRIDYGRSTYHLAGGVNHLSISTRLTEFSGQ